MKKATMILSTQSLESSLLLSGQSIKIEDMSYDKITGTISFVLSGENLPVDNNERVKPFYSTVDVDKSEMNKTRLRLYPFNTSVDEMYNNYRATYADAIEKR